MHVPQKLGILKLFGNASSSEREKKSTNKLSTAVWRNESMTISMKNCLIFFL